MKKIFGKANENQVNVNPKEKKKIVAKISKEEKGDKNLDKGSNNMNK